MQRVSKRAAIYARSAAVEELSPSIALEEQVRQVTAYAHAHGYTLAENFMYVEVASGATAERPRLLRALSDAKEGKFDVLLVLDYERIARKYTLARTLIGLFEAAGIAIESIEDEQVDVAAWELLRIVLTSAKQHRRHVPRKPTA